MNDNEIRKDEVSADLILASVMQMILTDYLLSLDQIPTGYSNEE